MLPYWDMAFLWAAVPEHENSFGHFGDWKVQTCDMLALTTQSDLEATRQHVQGAALPH